MCRAVVWACLLLCCGVPAAGCGAAVAAELERAAVAAEVRALVRAPPLSGGRAAVDDALTRIYRAAGDAPLWLGTGGANPAAPQAFAELADAPSHGLDPSDYLGTELRPAFDAIAAGDATPRQAARADVALTQAVLRYLRDLHSGRVAPDAAGFRMRARADGFDAAAHLQRALASGGLHDAVAAAEPAFVLYARLKAALAQYRALLDLPWPPPALLAVRVRQIELALERLRWLPPLPPGPLIAVNVPSYTLWAFGPGSERAAPALAMPVIVGRAARAMQTPAFVGEMRYVEFSPYWNVPPGIARNEIIPKLARDPSWLQREDMEIVGVRDALPETGVVDAATLERIAAGALRIRQRPGPKNALGGVKFALPNTMDIYLHGTPAQELFGRRRRDFSHGCIRVADPPALARFVLASRPEWTPERMRDAMGADKPVVVTLTDPIPVVIFYTTVVVADDGRAQFLPDVYGHDERLLRALRARGSGGG